MTIVFCGIGPSIWRQAPDAEISSSSADDLRPRPDLSFQHPTVVLAALPVQPDDASRVVESAPSSHSRIRAVVMIELG